MLIVLLHGAWGWWILLCGEPLHGIENTPCRYKWHRLSKAADGKERAHRGLLKDVSLKHHPAISWRCLIYFISTLRDFSSFLHVTHSRYFEVFKLTLRHLGLANALIQMCPSMGLEIMFNWARLCWCTMLAPENRAALKKPLKCSEHQIIFSATLWVYIFLCDRRCQIRCLKKGPTLPRL